MSFQSKIDQALKVRLQDGLLRKRQIISGNKGALLTICGQEVIQFCSNDYLGLAQHPEVIAALCESAKQNGAGSGASHLVSGHTQSHQRLEEALAKSVGREKALYFSTGYMANLAVVSALVDRNNSIIEDKLNHASLIDAARLSGAKPYRYKHSSVSHLNQRLENAEGNSLIVTDGVFSMDGDVAPLEGICISAKKHDAWVMVDDAHGYGVLGGGAGCVAEANLSQDDVQVLVCTLGKAMGTFGAFVAGTSSLIDYLVQFARPYIYTTALPAAMADSTYAALKVSQKEPWRRERVLKLTQAFKTFAEEKCIPLMASDTPIQPILVNDADVAVALSQELLSEGIWVSAIRPPTVPLGQSRLRVTFSAAHTDEQFERLTTTLDKVWAKYRGKI